MADALRLQRLCLDAKQWLAAASLPAAGDSEDPLRNCVLAYIGYWGCDRPSEPGVSRIDIGAALLNVAPVTATLAAVEWLRSEGYIYSTVDDYHFKTVDDCCMPGVPLDFARQRVPGMFGHLRPSPIAWPKSQFGPELDAAQTELINAVLAGFAAPPVPGPASTANPTQDLELAFQALAVLDLPWLPELPHDYSAPEHRPHLHGNPARVAVLRACRAGDDRGFGATTAGIAAALRGTVSSADMRQAVWDLAHLGYLYSTIDDDHFKVTLG
eukprot:m.132364 g.132364  ORF g.132364 m.132364 type:complete len:270 (-) comp9486_c0_seq2:159-968(-)